MEELVTQLLTVQKFLFSWQRQQMFSIDDVQLIGTVDIGATYKGKKWLYILGSG